MQMLKFNLCLELYTVYLLTVVMGVSYMEITFKVISKSLIKGKCLIQRRVHHEAISRMRWHPFYFI
jgi:hypothetical protein